MAVRGERRGGVSTLLQIRQVGGRQAPMGCPEAIFLQKSCNLHESNRLPAVPRCYGKSGLMARFQIRHADYYRPNSLSFRFGAAGVLPAFQPGPRPSRPSAGRLLALLGTTVGLAAVGCYRHSRRGSEPRPWPSCARALCMVLDRPRFPIATRRPQVEATGKEYRSIIRIASMRSDTEALRGEYKRASGRVAGEVLL